MNQVASDPASLPRRRPAGIRSGETFSCSLASLAWGTTFVVQKTAMGYLGPFTYSGIRFLLGALFLLPLVMYRAAKNPGHLPAAPQGAILGASLLTGVLVCVVKFVATNCKMPASWSGSVNSSTPTGLSLFLLSNSDSADTNYRLQQNTQFGEIVHETTMKRTGGASDGTTGISWKMVSTANAEWSHQTLDTPEMVRWNEKTGVSVTATIEIVHDSVTNLTDKEIWLEAMYLGTSGYPLGSLIDDAAANYLSSGADQTASTETWTTTGLTNPNKQKLSVTFTPQEKGTIRCVVKLAKASKTVYVDPKLNVTY